MKSNYLLWGSYQHWGRVGAWLGLMQIGAYFVPELVERTANNVLTAMNFYKCLPFFLAGLLAVFSRFEFNAKTIVVPGGVKQYYIGYTCGNTFGFHYRGFPCVSCATIRNRKKKAAYFRVLQPKPSNAVFL